MNNKYKVCILISALLSVATCWAQTNEEGAKAINNVSLADNVGSSLFTGRVIYSIPIYTIEDPDFHLDITLKYSTEGFKPFQPSGCYGQDWSLEAGGYISRVVQGKPDDQVNRYFTYSDIYPEAQDIGFIYAWKDGNHPSKDEIFNFNSNVYNEECGVLFSGYGFGPPWWSRDYMPDIFKYNFCGHKGVFIINNTGEARIISGDFIKIDVSNITTCHNGGYCNHTHSPDSSKITITTKDGYRYIFGGDKNALEYSALFKTRYNNTYQSNIGIPQERPAISAWHIKQIIAPNGRVMTFDYESGTQSGANLNTLQTFVTDYDWSEQYVGCCDNDSTHILYFLHKECLLHAITISGATPLTISFSSHQEAFPKYENSAYNYCVRNLELDSITVLCDNRVLKTAKLLYQYKSHNMAWGEPPYCSWRFLRQVAISGVGKYTMEYNELPPSGGNVNLLYLYPNLYVHTNTSYKNMVDRFGIWKAIPQQGTLSQVSLPTGGKLKFTYGEHQYAEERRFCAIGNQNIELSSQNVSNQSIGGIRVEKIETFSDNNILAETKTFSYTQPDNSTSSSGVFYNIYEVFNIPGITGSKPILNPNNYGIVNSHIGYSSVLCTTTTAGGNTYKTAYTFDVGSAAYSSLNNNTINRRTNIQNYDAITELQSGSLTYSGFLIPIGKLLSVKQYLGNTIQKATYYRYNGINHTTIELPPLEGPELGCTDTIVCLSTYSAHTARKLFVYPDVLEQVVTYEYESGNTPMVTETTLTYDSKFRKKQVRFTDSQERKRFIRYTYPDDLHFSFSNIFPDLPAVYLLQQAYRINTPVEEIAGYIKNDTEYITSGKINLYATGSYYYLPGSNPMQSPAYIHPFLGENTTQINFSDSLYPPGFQVSYYPYLYKTLSLSLRGPITDYLPLGTAGSSVVYDGYYMLDTEYSFDHMGRLLSVKPFGKIETKYTWNGIYPSSKTIGNQTTTYTYIPYVGVSSMKDPRGITTYYSYDSAGRLIEEYQLVNGQKQILHVYQYHIKTE